MPCWHPWQTHCHFLGCLSIVLTSACHPLLQNTLTYLVSQTQSVSKTRSLPSFSLGQTYFIWFTQCLRPENFTKKCKFPVFHSISKIRKSGNFMSSFLLDSCWHKLSISCLFSALQLVKVPTTPRAFHPVKFSPMKAFRFFDPWFGTMVHVLITFMLILGNITYYKLLNSKEKKVLTIYSNGLLDVTTIFKGANMLIYFHLNET